MGDEFTDDFSGFCPGRGGERTPETGEYGLLDNLPLDILHRLCLDEVVESCREPLQGFYFLRFVIS